ncbi:MAG: hypothetical protein Rhims3KO_11290 [Hyphomicrobiales bacterium]
MPRGRHKNAERVSNLIATAMARYQSCQIAVALDGIWIDSKKVVDGAAVQIYIIWRLRQRPFFGLAVFGVAIFGVAIFGVGGEHADPDNAKEIKKLMVWSSDRTWHDRVLFVLRTS